MQVRSDARAARRPDVRAAVLLSAGLASSSASAADPAACTWVLDVAERLTDRLTVERAIRVDAPRFVPDDIPCLCQGGAPGWVVQIAREELLLDGWSNNESSRLALYGDEATFPIARQVALALVSQLRRNPQLYAEDGFYFHPFPSLTAPPSWLALDRFAEAFEDASTALDASRARTIALRAEGVDGIDARRLATLSAGPTDPAYDKVARFLRPRATAFVALDLADEGETALQISVRIDRFTDSGATSEGNDVFLLDRTTLPVPSCTTSEPVAVERPTPATRAPAARTPGDPGTPSPSAVRLRRWYAWTGVGLAAVGGALTAVSYSRYKGLETEHRGVYTTDVVGRMSTWKQLNIASGAIAVAGGLTATVGFALPLPKRVREAQPTSPPTSP